MRDLWGRHPIRFIHKPVEGRAVGILVIWNSKSIEVTNSRIGEFFISVLCRNKEDGSRWAFSGVYGPCAQEASLRLWEELSNILNYWKVPWCLGGDFNVV